MQKLYRFNLDCGRMGELEGVFTASTSQIENISGKFIEFGEVLGKHSEIFIDKFDSSYLEVLSEDQEFVKKYSEIIGSAGFNPLDYYHTEE